MFESSTISTSTEYDLTMSMGTLLSELFFAMSEVTYEELPDLALEYCLLNNEVVELIESI